MINDDEKDLGGHEEVLKLITITPELKNISKQLKNKNDKEIFEDILWSLLYYQAEIKRQFTERSVDRVLDKNSIYQYCKEYIDSDFAHCSFLTNAIIEQIIDVELLQLESGFNDISYLGNLNGETIHLRSISTKPLNKSFLPVLSLLFFTVGIFVVYFLFSAGFTGIALGVVCLLAWHYFGTLTVYYKSEKLKNTFSDSAIKFRRIRNEISSHSFDPATISERIKSIENEGIYISSLIYPLLNIDNRT